MENDLAVLLGKRFIQRRDVKSEQGSDGGWYTKEQPWKMSDIRAHIEGQRTYGHYLLDQNSLTKIFVYDLDLVKEGYTITLTEDEILNGGQPCNPREVFLDESNPGREWLVIQLRCMAEALAMKIVRMTDGEVPVAISFSGSKGLHVYGMLPDPIPAAEARLLALGILDSFHCFEPVRGKNFFRHTRGAYENLEVEVYPKQDNLDDQRLGNLVALPLGIHRKTGNQRFFVDCRTPYSVLKPLDPMKALSGEMMPWGGAYEDGIN